MIYENRNSIDLYTEKQNLFLSFTRDKKRI